MQDAIFTAGSIFFIIGLIPSIRGEDKPALFTSLTTGGWLFLFAITYLTFAHPLWFSSITTFGTSLCWFTLAWQKWSQPDPVQQWKRSSLHMCNSEKLFEPHSNAGFATINPPGEDTHW